MLPAVTVGGKEVAVTVGGKEVAVTVGGKEVVGVVMPTDGAAYERRRGTQSTLAELL